MPMQALRRPALFKSTNQTKNRHLLGALVFQSSLAPRTEAWEQRRIGRARGVSSVGAPTPLQTVSHRMTEMHTLKTLI
jgi:hypothetical protein